MLPLTANVVASSTVSYSTGTGYHFKSIRAVEKYQDPVEWYCQVPVGWYLVAPDSSRNEVAAVMSMNLPLNGIKTSVAICSQVEQKRVWNWKHLIAAGIEFQLK